MSNRSLHGGHTTIHNNNAYHDAAKEERQLQEQQKPSMPGSHAAVERMTAVQVVDRLRWWRTHRVREQPIPVDHFVLRGSYANYSSFGTRPLAPSVTRLLQKARTVRAQYLRTQQQPQHEAPRQSRQVSSLLMAPTAGASVRSASNERLGSDAGETERTTGCISEEEGQYGERQQRQLREMNDDAKEKVNNKRRAAVIASWPRSPRPLNEVAIACLGEPAGQRDSATDNITRISLSASGSAGTSPPLVRAVSGSAPSVDTPSGALYVPSEQEARVAERLLMLFRPRAASAPLRSRRYRCTAGRLDATSSEFSGEPPLQGDWGHAEATGLHHERMTRVSASDEITDVRRAPGAAEAVIVLHHAPRLVLYEKGLNPKAALRAAGISSDALESLDDAAAESSAELFALRNLPLFAFERFFYQQQLRGLAETRRSHTPGMRSASADASAESAGVPESDTASAPTGAAAGAVAAADTAVDDDIIANGDDAFFFGSPLTATLACSLKTVVPLSSVAAAAAPGSRGRDGRDAAARQAVQHRGRGRDDGSNRRRGGRAALRAVSVPALPPVYKGGCPQMTLATSHHHLSSGARLQQQQQSSNRPSPILSAGLRSSKAPQNGAHLCLRVDDLQDVYVFNPVVDMIGKGAFSKVYAAVPILRGKEGLRRFASPLLDGQAAPCGSDELSGSGPREGGRRVSTVRRVSPVRRNSSSTALRVDPAAGAAVGDAAGPLTDDETAKRRPHAQSLAASLHSIPVVALKVIPRKARQKPKAAPDPLATTHSTAAAAAGSVASNAQQAAQNDQNSVRRELVEIEREVSILRSLHHTGCSQFFEAIRTPDAFVIAMRVFPGSMDAQRYLSRYGAPSEARAALLLFQLVSTVQYLHTNFGLIHRDIKLENILLSEADAGVPDARIREVLGPALHKSDTSAMMTEIEGGRKGCASATTAAETRTAAQRRYSMLSRNVARLLRVTLIDFGLARRTRASTLSPIVAASRGRGAGAQHGSLNATITSPTHLASFPPTSASLAASHPHASHNPNSSSYSGSLGSPASSSAGCAAGVVMLANGGNSSSNSYTPAKPAPPKPPLLCRPPSAAVGAGTARLGSSSAGISAMERSTPRAGMPSPMPSTANMFTRFLDLEEEMDEEENGGAAGTSNTTANTTTKVGDLGRGGRRDMAENEDDSGAFSTDVSASETDCESEGGSTAEPKEGSAPNGEERLETGPQQEHVARKALISPSVLRAHPQTPPGSAIIVSPPLPPTPMLLSSTTAFTLDHFNAENSSSSCNTSGPAAGGAGLRNRCASCIYTSHQQLSPAPPVVAAGVSSAPDDTEATLLLTPCGTEKYLPPEVLSWILEHGWARRSTTVGLARAMDLYSIGIVAYVLLSGCFPFNASSRATLLQQQQRVPRCNSARWTGVSSAAISFVQRLLEPNPRKRMTAKEALEHPFLHEARQLAEKLSLVPHGEGEEASHPSTWRDGSHMDNHHRHSIGGTGRHFEDDANVHARSHWATSTTATTNLPHSAPSPTHPDHTHSGAAIERASTQPSSSVSLAVYDSQRRHAGGPCELAAANEPSPLSSNSGADGGGELLCHHVESGTAPTATSISSGCRLSDAPRVCRSSDECERDDVRASVTRDVPGKVQPLLQVCKESPYSTTPPVPVTPTLAKPCTAALARAASIELPALSSLVAHPAKPSPSSTLYFTATGTTASADGGRAERATLPEPESAAAGSSAPALAPGSKDAAAANRPVSLSPAATTSTARATEGGEDDLFESLYNNIMSSD
ncbi:protein kinase, putative [Leishmania donovani]|uniref:Protein kinase, putative n=1 Tax=Leishmania donovani TaxID=5661 RepID=E9BIM2_LEIDO|nr:protein kinase, putative [Leishmania donovani]CBZ35098.1 protein kinase, putative [Leishmania donovani]